jgi:hypothetical protein
MRMQLLQCLEKIMDYRDVAQIYDFCYRRRIGFWHANLLSKAQKLVTEKLSYDLYLANAKIYRNLIFLRS